ncbi:hypothetical protein ElyMa_000702700 [Elysia marginata]|uniref:Uncharacterized protein n=1 Tax=Elysia marginata TaxID=1093978 RepID=A0AAV4GJ00_9GAST|nr:hypothetical protein ElyMa_000702700 [Elysia marginata]
MNANMGTQPAGTNNNNSGGGDSSSNDTSSNNSSSNNNAGVGSGRNSGVGGFSSTLNTNNNGASLLPQDRLGVMAGHSPYGGVGGGGSFPQVGHLGGYGGNFSLYEKIGLSQPVGKDNGKYGHVAGRLFRFGSVQIPASTVT